MERLSELQWEFISKSWKNNIDIWYPEKRWIFSPLTFSAHWCWFRWKHGKKATIPMMHLAGLSDSSLPIKVIKKCDTAYCQSGLEDTMATVKEKVFGNGR